MKNLVVCLYVLSQFCKSLEYTRLPVTDTPPERRQYLCAGYYEAENSIIVFGGNEGIYGTYNDV